jgi:hypothetical protein
MINTAIFLHFASSTPVNLEAVANQGLGGLRVSECSHKRFIF